MTSHLEFFVGLLAERDPAPVAAEDLAGPHGTMLRRLQRKGFLSREAGMHPVPSCPRCGEGVPYRLQGSYLCNRCSSAVDENHLLLWRLNLDTFLRWLAAQLRLRSGVRCIEEQLWQLGTWEQDGAVYECFYERGGPLSAAGNSKLTAYRNVILLYGFARPPEAERGHATCISLLEILQIGKNTLRVMDRRQLLRERGEVRFDVRSGTVKVGGVWQGEVPVASKEYFLLVCLSQHLDQFVTYEDIKHFVLQHTGGKDTTEEATFCHRLKNRIKNAWIPRIDLLLATTNKGDGYKMRRHVGTVSLR